MIIDVKERFFFAFVSFSRLWLRLFYEIKNVMCGKLSIDRVDFHTGRGSTFNLLLVRSKMMSS